VLDVLLLLSVAGGFLQGLDDERRGRGDDGNRGLTVLDGELDGDTESFPVSSCFCDIFSNLLWRQTQRTDLGSKGGRCTDFASSGSKVAK